MHSAPAPPGWLAEVVACPVDGAHLAEHEGSYLCHECGRSYPAAEGIVELLPDRLAHLGHAGGEGRAAAADEATAWVSDEMDWWEPYYAKDHGRPYSPTAGLRGRSRERNLFRHVRERAGSQPRVVEMGAGSSRSVAGLWPPAQDGIRYVATDLSRGALRVGAAGWGEGAAAVQCEAGTWPFRRASLDVVLVFGVLHHLPAWDEALRRACLSVRPGGHLLLHEVVHKPRILARRRSAGINDAWTSPHEGNVAREDLRRGLEELGTVVRWRGESTPLRFAFVHYLNLHERLERSRALTVGLDLLDQAFGRTLGRVRPSLGFAEVTCVWRRGGADSAPVSEPPRAALPDPAAR